MTIEATTQKNRRYIRRCKRNWGRNFKSQLKRRWMVKKTVWGTFYRKQR